MNAADLVELLTDHLPTRGRIACAHPDEVHAIMTHRPTGSSVEGVVVDDLTAGGRARWDGVLLLRGQVAAAGIRGAGVVADAVEASRPGGLIALAGPSATWQALAATGRSPTSGGQTGRGRDNGAPAAMTSTQMAHALEERGCELRLLAGVGASAAMAGRAWAGLEDLDMDQTPGLTDAGPTVLAAGRTPKTAAERSRVFFSSITTRIVAASVICVDHQDRLLLIDDLFKGAWSLPGGLVDADEAPDVGARREALEEGGVDVQVGALLGVFSHIRPDRVHLIYAASPIRPTPSPVPIHTHEIGESRWVPRDEALQMVPADIRRKIETCLDTPGGTWHF